MYPNTRLLLNRVSSLLLSKQTKMFLDSTNQVSLTPTLAELISTTSSPWSGTVKTGTKMSGSSETPGAPDGVIKATCNWLPRKAMASVVLRRQAPSQLLTES